MKIFFSVGEPSGDLHGANLIRAIQQHRPETKCVGYGGPRMADAGCELHADLTELAVMWFLRAILNLHRFWGLMWQADQYFREERPDAVVLIDYPGFNWWIARRARSNGIPVFYYGAPQMWAWAGWRIKKMRRLVDHVLCKLPFESDWYQTRGCDAVFVGHPFFDETHQHQTDHSFVEELSDHETPLVTILPGSRNQEVESNLAAFLVTAQKIKSQMPECRFAIAAFNEQQAMMAREQVAAVELPISIHVGRTPELIQAATVCLACSGSVSLQLMHYRKPTVIHYRISRFAFFVQRFFRTVRYITLVNLFAAEDRFEMRKPSSAPQSDIPFPEFLTCDDRSDEMSQLIVRWLNDPIARQRVIDQLGQLCRQFGQPGASDFAAQYILCTTAKDAATKTESQVNEAA